jgi:hypothetical protein
MEILPTIQIWEYLHYEMSWTTHKSITPVVSISHRTQLYIEEQGYLSWKRRMKTEKNKRKNG